MIGREIEELFAQLESKISQIVDQIHWDGIIAESFKTQLREKINTFVKEQSQSLSLVEKGYYCKNIL